jgi:hypothetical protein
MRKNIDDKFANIVHELLGVFEDLRSKCRFHDLGSDHSQEGEKAFEVSHVLRIALVCAYLSHGG